MLKSYCVDLNTSVFFIQRHQEYFNIAHSTSSKNGLKLRCSYIHSLLEYFLILLSVHQVLYSKTVHWFVIYMPVNYLYLLLLYAADSTGLESLYTQLGDYEIMFHVSTLLPFTPNNRQQVMEWFEFKYWLY